MADEEPAAGEEWWRKAVVYQIYVRSFQDSDGDGLGDLEGVIARLDHLTWLGVDALWLSPIHPSPMIDGGYDITDFQAVDPRFGDLPTFDRLVAEAHGRGLKVILDFVPNHTSDQHPWFRESRSTRTNPKRDWYVWQDGDGSGPPNNWGSMLSGPAWTRDAETEQFYYHAFLPEQPDLNWRNPSVRAAMADVLRFWLARGVDGLRVDAVPHLVEDDLLRDDLPADVNLDVMPVQSGLRHVYTSNRPENLDCMAAMRAVVDEFDGRVLIGEAHLPIALTVRYAGVDRPGVHMPFNFGLLETPWDVRAIGAVVDQYVSLLPRGGCPNWLVGNHDEARVATRIGAEQARAAVLLAFTLGGAAFMYNGEELGLTGVPYGRRDLAAVPEMRHPDHALKYMPHRSPMPWDGGRHGGFTTGEPYLPLGTRNEQRNVLVQSLDERSTLTFYKRLIALRRTHPALASGEYRPLRRQGDVLTFQRASPGKTVQVAVNFSGSDTTLRLPSVGKIVLSTRLDRDGAFEAEVVLRANEGVVFQLDG